MPGPPSPRQVAASRSELRDPLIELVVLGVALTAVGSLVRDQARGGVEVGLVFAVAVLATGAIGLGARQALGAVTTEAVTVEAAVLPGLTAGAAILGGGLVPPGLLLVPWLVASGALLVAAVAAERRVLERVHGPTAGDRTAVRTLALVVAALAFAGVAAAIPGALVEPAGSGQATAAIPAGSVAFLALADAALAAVLGYRLTALRDVSLREASLAGVSYALVVGIAAAALRAMMIPRFLGPALLVLILYLWDAYRASPRPVRRDLRSIWELLLLLLVGIVVVAWNLLSQV